LPPKDRLIYQVVADEAALAIDRSTDKSRSFSHRLADEGEDAMFLSSRKCWSELQKNLRQMAVNEAKKYVLRLDVADYFGSINQHTLINAMKSCGVNKALAERLEKILLGYTGQRSSRGIIQGIYPSDLFGAFYMAPVDRFFDDLEIPSARYVDDLYIFVASVDEADHVLRKLIPFLRSYDLNLNEVKSTILSKMAMLAEEPDLEELFSEAVAEISEQLKDEDTDTDYGFQQEWGQEDTADQPLEECDLELSATKALFDSIGNFPGHEEAIERFCLPLFTKAESDYAVDYVLDQIKRRPSMTQIYAAYLGRFVRERVDVQSVLIESLKDIAIYDWQKMWIAAALMQVENGGSEAVKIMVAILNDASRHDALRAVAAIFVGRFGDHGRRVDLFNTYRAVPEYVQLAIFYSSATWPPVERKNARASWGGHGPLHILMAAKLTGP
jgi:hypothetical protein